MSKPTQQPRSSAAKVNRPRGGKRPLKASNEPASPPLADEGCPTRYYPSFPMAHRQSSSTAIRYYR